MVVAWTTFGQDVLGTRSGVPGLGRSLGPRDSHTGPSPLMLARSAGAEGLEVECLGVQCWDSHSLQVRFKEWTPIPPVPWGLQETKHLSGLRAIPPDQGKTA